MKRTYHGSCHCKAVTFEADIDLSNGTNKCNCTFCWKQRMWNAGQLDPQDFRIVSAKAVWATTPNQATGVKVTIGSARHAGLQPIATVALTRWAVHFSRFTCQHWTTCRRLTLLLAPVHFMDGLHDNWQSPPFEARHL